MHPARLLWATLEPLHAAFYFTPEVRTAGKEIGLRGYWDTYFAFRAAPLGQVGADAVVAVFAGFAPDMVARSLPSAWERASAQSCLAARNATATSVLRTIGVDDEGCAAAVELLSPITWPTTGRPLGAANAAVPLPADPVGALWQLATTYREHRGDGHIAALIAAGLSGVDAMLLQVARGRFLDDTMRTARGWSPEEWAAARESLVARGLVSDDGLTDDGAELLEVVEEMTDDLAWHDESVAEEVVSVLAPSVAAVWASGVLPEENPIGLRHA